MRELSGGEFSFINWVRRSTPRDPRVPIGIGDDTAAVSTPGGGITLITTDMLLEGSCFILEEAGPYRVGSKAMRVNLSDIAAMAGVPTFAVVSVGLPRRHGREIAEALYAGLRQAAQVFGVAIVGGDTNSWDGPLTISVTLLGETVARGPVRRSGARLGDWVMVTGPLGGSILGKHLNFTPRVREALTLHELVELHAMIDISDGLAQDLGHILTESGVGAVLQASNIPISEAAIRLAEQTGKTPLEHALGDGEDFELLFTVSPADGRRLLKDQPVPDIQLAHIGEILDAGLWLEGTSGRAVLQAKGYVHELEG